MSSIDLNLANNIIGTDYGHDNMALSGERSALSGLSDLRKEKAEEKENLW